MNRKTLTTIQIVLAIIVVAYWVLPDFMLGPLDDGVIAALALIAEVVLFVVRAVKMPSNSESGSNNTSYQQYEQYNGYSNGTDYQHSNQNSRSDYESDERDEEFQFFAGCTDWEQVKKRYRELMKIYHPDAGGHEEASKKINAEYNILKKKYGH
jgi:hypothetical protein